MKAIAWISLMFLLTGCMNDELSWMSISNNTEVPFYAQPYSSEFTEGDWIQPGVMSEFYSIKCDCLDGFSYFSFYYDSLIIYLEDDTDCPVKFYKDGTTVNYDPTLNPFTNPDVWRNREFDRTLPGDSFNSTIQEKHISEHYFCIDSEFIKSLSDTILQELNPSF